MNYRNLILSIHNSINELKQHGEDAASISLSTRDYKALKNEMKTEPMYFLEGVQILESETLIDNWYIVDTGKGRAIKRGVFEGVVK